MQAVIVRRVVKARKNAAAGIPQELPTVSPTNSTGRPDHETDTGTTDASQKELPSPPKKKPWYSALKCW